MSDAQSMMRRKFDELVPWYVTGELAPDDRAWVDRYLAEHPESNDALQWHQELARSVDDRYQQLPAAAGWSGLAARLESERASKRSSPSRAQAPSLSERIADWLGQLVARPAYALACAFIVAQAAVIGVLVSQQQENQPEWVTTRGGAPSSASAVQVRFRPSATEKELRALLSEAGARIVDGPDQLGDYIVVPRTGSADQLGATLKQSELVTSVERFEWKPAAGDGARP